MYIDFNKFHYNPQLHDPQTIAAKDYQEFGVDRIIKHAWNIKNPTSLDFLVRWVGYDESEDLWLPWSELRNNTKLHDYLREKGLLTLTRKIKLLKLYRV